MNKPSSEIADFLITFPYGCIVSFLFSFFTDSLVCLFFFFLFLDCAEILFKLKIKKRDKKQKINFS